MDVSSLPLSLASEAEAGQAPAAALPAAAESGRSADRGASLQSLRQIRDFRTIALTGQVFAVAVASAMGVALPLAPVLAIITALLVCNVLLGRRLRAAAPTSHVEVFAHLAIDLLAFTGVLLLAGGASNPFVSLYFLHVALAGLLLPRRLALVGLALALLAVGLCARFGVPLELAEGRAIPPVMMNTARWLSFALSAAMIVWFVGRVTGALQAHQDLLAEAARKAANDETMLRIGTIAAGAAHELATPLMSMSIIVKEWERQGVAAPLQRDVAMLASQIAACKQALANLRSAASQARLEAASAEPLDAMLHDLANRCRAMRPTVELKCDVEGPRPAPTVLPDAGFKQAVLVLLNNAADACPEDVRLAGRWDASELELVIADSGAGIPPAKLPLLGRSFFTTKSPGKGTGLGLMLTASTVDRLGGTVRWFNRPEGGACAQMRVPLSSLQRNANEAHQ